MPPFQNLLDSCVQKKSHKERVRVSRGCGTPPSFWFLAKNCWTLKAVWAGELSSCKNQYPLCQFFWTFSSQVLTQSFQHIQVKLLIYCCSGGKTSVHFPSHQHQDRNQHFSWHWSELAALFLIWANLVTSAYHSSTQRPLTYNTQHSQQTDIHASGGIRTHNLSWRVAADLRLRPRGYWDRRNLDLLYK